MDATYELHAELLKVMATPRRLQILHLLGTGPRDIAALASGIGTTEPNVSQDLAVLRAAQIVKKQPVGRLVRYALCDREVMAACELIRDLVRRRLAHTPLSARRDGRPHTTFDTPRRAAPH